MQLETNDLTYKAVSDDKKGTHFDGFSTQTVMKCIKEIEEKYFAGRHIYKNAGEKSDVLFRSEIKGLLLLLLKLELNDPLRDSKTKKSGISEDKISEIRVVYEWMMGYSDMEDYEFRLLFSFFNSKESMKFLDILQNFSENLFLLLELVVKNYRFFPSEYFTTMNKQMVEWSCNIIKYKEDITKRMKNNVHILNLNSSNLTGFFDCAGELSLDLKNGVVKAINELSEICFEFDKYTGVCKRKKWQDEFKDTLKKTEDKKKSGRAKSNN